MNGMMRRCLRECLLTEGKACAEHQQQNADTSHGHLHEDKARVKSSRLETGVGYLASGGVHLNWRELRFGEAKFSSQKLSYLSTVAAKKKWASQTLAMQEGSHEIGMVGVKSRFHSSSRKKANGKRKLVLTPSMRMPVYVK